VNECLRSKIKHCIDCNEAFIEITPEIEAGIVRERCPFCQFYVVDGQVKIYIRDVTYIEVRYEEYY
jgi:hypothetical protein